MKSGLKGLNKLGNASIEGWVAVSAAMKSGLKDLNVLGVLFGV